MPPNPIRRALLATVRSQPTPAEHVTASSEQVWLTILFRFDASAHALHTPSVVNSGQVQFPEGQYGAVTGAVPPTSSAPNTPVDISNVIVAPTKNKCRSYDLFFDEGRHVVAYHLTKSWNIVHSCQPEQ